MASLTRKTGFRILVATLVLLRTGDFRLYRIILPRKTKIPISNPRFAAFYAILRSRTMRAMGKQCRFNQTYGDLPMAAKVGDTMIIRKPVRFTALVGR